MAWDGSGNFSRTKSWTADRDAAIKILASRHDENDDELRTGINACTTRDGQAKPTADWRPNADNSLSLGASTLRWLNAWLSGAVKFKQTTFAASLDAETLTGDRTIKLPDESFTIRPHPTGAVVSYIGTTAPTAWLLLDGKTIGDASSSATGRANADCEALFTLLWNSFADAQAAVGGGRGASAAADWAAHKAIALPDARGRAIFGQDDMGGSAASRLTSAGSGVDGATLGVTGGSQLLHGHTHTGTTASGGAHTHTVVRTDASGGATGLMSGLNTLGTHETSSAGAHTHTITTDSTGSGSSQNVPPALVLNYIIKL